MFSDDYRALVAVVVAARREAGVTQRSLAHRLGKAASHVGQIERGQRRVDALELYYIARCLGLRPTALFARIEQSLDRLHGEDLEAA